MSSSRLSGISVDPGDGEEVVDTLGGGESACSCENSGRGSSGRRTFERSSGFAVGGTPERSSSWIFSMLSRIASSCPPIFSISSSVSPNARFATWHLLFGYHVRSPVFARRTRTYLNAASVFHEGDESMASSETLYRKRGLIR